MDDITVIVAHVVKEQSLPAAEEIVEKPAITAPAQDIGFDTPQSDGDSSSSVEFPEGLAEGWA